jgi:hypothetical protein
VPARGRPRPWAASPKSVAGTSETLALEPVLTEAASPELLPGEAFLALTAIAACLVAGSAATATASGQTLPSSQHDAVPVGGQGQSEHALPATTRATPQPRCTYLVHRTHRFYHLSSSFRFPASFIHLAQTAHATWCTHHPIMCRAQKAQSQADAIANPHDSCGAGWWCHDRGLISRAGGGMAPYW